MIDNPGGYKVPVVQAASYSKVLGDVVVTFDDAGVVKEAKGDPIWLDKSVTPDAAALAKHQGTRRADPGSNEERSRRHDSSRSTATANHAAPWNARWAT
jgi:2',3'-cyclic-nucleotide 2'-phosphodiesterase (5'-nucleotidase family)